jgi:fucose permease
VNWIYIILSYVSLFALGLGDNSRGPLFPEILKSFQISDTEGATYFAVTSFFGFVGSYLVPFLLRKLPRVQTLQLAAVLMALALAGMSFAREFSWLLVFSSVLGLSFGIVGVVQNVLVTLGSSPEKRQRMLSGLHSFYGISSLLAPLIVAGIMSVTDSWRSVFLWVAIVPAALAAAAFFYRESEIPRANTRKPFSVRWIHIYVGIALGLYVLAEIMVSSRLALFVRRDLGLDLQESSYYLTGFFLCLLAGRLLFTVVHFHWPLRRMLSLALFLSALSIFLGLHGHPFFFAISGFFMGPFYPLAMSYIYRHFNHEIDSAISTCMSIQYILTVAMHFTVGYLTDRLGIAQAFYLGPVALISSLLILNSFETLFKKSL